MVFFEGLSLSILALVAGIMILAGWVPQIIKGYKTKKLDDVSKYLKLESTHKIIILFVFCSNIAVQREHTSRY